MSQNIQKRRDTIFAPGFQGVFDGFDGFFKKQHAQPPTQAYAGFGFNGARVFLGSFSDVGTDVFVVAFLWAF